MSRERTLHPLWTTGSKRAGRPGKTQLPRSLSRSSRSVRLVRSSCLSLSAEYSSRVLDAILRDVANVNGIFWPMLVNRKPGERPKRTALTDLVRIPGVCCLLTAHRSPHLDSHRTSSLTISLAAFSRLNGPESPGNNPHYNRRRTQL